MTWPYSLYIKLSLWSLMAMCSIACSGPKESGGEQKLGSAPTAPTFQIYRANFDIPDLDLLNQHGASVALSQIMDRDSALFVQFIFTTCPTICPALSAEFAALQNYIEADEAAVQLVSISIDPEYDRPEHLKWYGRQFDSKSCWTFLTGDREDINLVQKAFENFEGNKMYHRPVSFFKAANSLEWLVCDGFISGEDMWGLYVNGRQKKSVSPVYRTLNY